MREELLISDTTDSRNTKVAEVLDFADLYSSFKINWQLNSTYEISFTATYTDQFKDAFNMLQMKKILFYHSQPYVIQQLENGFDEYGLPTIQVTANHRMIDLMKNVRIDPSEPTEENPETSGGDSSSDDSGDDQKPQPGSVTVKRTDEQQTFTLKDRLDQFFNNNDQGINYELHGNFPEAAVDCSGSLYDWLGSNLATFGAYYIPDRLTLKIYDLPSLRKDTDMVFHYMNNVSSVNIQSSGNDIVNDCEVFGGKMEKDIVGTGTGSDSGGSGNGGNLDNVVGFCKSPINADFGVNKAAMIQNFAARSTRARAWGVDANRLYDVVKQNGVSPEWFFAYELQEQLDTYGRDSWLNHYGNHLGDPYQDAARVCNWIKSIAASPSFTAATEGGKGNQSLVAQWNKEFPVGTIGRVYLQATAAAAWELEGIAGGYYGKPLSGCVSVIKSWGGHTVVNQSAGWGWPFPNIPKDGEPKWIDGQQYGYTSYPRGSTNFHDGFDFGSSWYNGNALAVHPGTVHQISTYAGQWWFIWVKSNDGYNEIYQEGFNNGDIYVHVGQQVNVGTPLARVTQSHTHIGITKQQIPVAYYHGYDNDGTWLNPIQVIKDGINGKSGGSTPQPQKKGRAEEFVQFCKSFVGKTPYVWGGNTPSGWDCSGFVAYVYNHFGVPMHQPTTYEEYQGTVVGPPYQTGDMLFWGPRGHTYHTSLAMDANYRVGADNYQDGTVYRTISSFTPSFGVRNAQMAAILGGTIDDTPSTDDSTTTQSYYALHYHYHNTESVDKYGIHRGEPIVMDSLYDMNALQNYVDATVQHDPPTSITNNQYDELPEEGVQLGYTAQLIVPEKNLNTTVTLVGFDYNPFNPSSDDTTLTWDNTGLAMKNDIFALYQVIKPINRNIDQLNYYGATGGRYENHFADIVNNQSSSKQIVRLNANQVKTIQKFVDS